MSERVDLLAGPRDADDIGTEVREDHRANGAGPIPANR